MMNDRIALLRRTTARDGAGQRLPEAWTPLPEIWANVKFQSGAEAMRADADVSIVKCSIRIRVRPDVDATMKARYKRIDYDIKAVLPDSKDRDFVFLVCEATK